MISTDFAPNENLSDAIKSLSVSANPSAWFIGNSTVRMSESLLAYFPNHHINLFLTARAALYSYLKSLGLVPGGEVLVTGFTCKAVIIPIIALQLKPVFVDINTETYSMDIADIKKKFTQKTKLIILQHTFGIPPHRKEIITLAKKFNVPVLEDMAHGFDETLMKKDRFGTDKLLSFGRTKVMSSMYGGAIITTDPHTYKKLEGMIAELPFPNRSFLFMCLMYKPLNVFMRDTYDYGIGKATHFVLNTLKAFPKEVSKTEDMLGFDPYVLKKYPNALAGLMVHQLNKFQAMQDTRRRTTNYYSDAQGAAFHNLPLNRFPLLVKDHDSLYKKLAKNHIFLGRWYREVLPPAGACPVTEHVSAHIINLPTLIPIKDAERVVNAIDSSIVLS